MSLPNAARVLPGRHCHALCLAITSALLATGSESLQAACGPLAAGSYITSQSCTPTTGNEASLTTQPGTTITTTSGVSVLARATNANAGITLNGTTVTSTPATAVNAVLAQVLGLVTPGTASVQVTGGTSQIRLIGAGQDGLGVSNAGTGLSSVSVANGTVLNITNTITGTEHDGIDVNASAGGDISFSHAGSGTITTFGGNSIWLKATGSGNITANIGAGNNLIVDNNDPLSAGDPNLDDENDPQAGTGNHAGVHTRAINGTTTVINAATLTGLGTNAFGIFTEGGTGTTQLTNSGAITTNGLNGFGIRAVSTTGSINVVNSGAITTTGGGGYGIYVNDNVGSTGSISIENNGALDVGNAADTVGSRALYVIKRGTGDVSVSGSGDITVHGGLNTLRAFGILITAASNARVAYSGDIVASGAGAGGIRVDAATGNVIIDYSGERIETFNGNANAIYATAPQGSVVINASGTLITHSNTGSGDGSGIGSFGLQALTGGGDVSVTFSGTRIDVNGAGAAILAGNAFDVGTGTGTVAVSNSGELIARGNNQRGIRTQSATGTQSLVNQGAITTLGATASQGILAEATGAASVSVDNSGDITTHGNESSAIDALTQGGTVIVDNSAVLSGGWGTSTGVSLGGVTQTLTNTGTIGALSDLAILGDASGPDATLVITNSGQIEGAINAATSQVSISNLGVWTLRNYADTNGDGSRDTWAVALSNLGTASGNSIDNVGTLKLAAQPTTGITTFDTSGAFLPLAQVANTPVLGGAVQAQLLGVQTFTNSGVIDLTGGSDTVGNVLLISNAQVAGINGGGVFVSNGGRLLLNTELNEGGASTRSDLLVVDSTQTGAGGATGLVVNNVGGRGALTEGNGIAVVTLLDSSVAASDANAFTLARRVVAGPYEYQLYRGAENGSGTDTWYLRSDVEPAPPDPDPPTPPQPPTPNYRPEVSLYGALPALALVYNRTLIDTLHERVGEERDNSWDPLPAQDDSTKGPSMGWGRVIYRSGTQDSDRKNALGNTPQYNYDLTAFQVGTDLYRKVRTDGSQDRAGLSLAIGSIDAGVSHYTGANAGNDTLRAYSLGGYWTHFGPAGWYLDSVLQVSRYDIEAQPDQLAKLKTQGWGYTGSLETGYPFKRDDGVWIEPQAQVIYSRVNLDSSDDLGANVRFRDVTSLIGRLGVRLAKDWENQDSDQTRRRTQGWLRPSVWHEFKGQPKTEFSSQTGYIPFAADLDGTWGEVNLGVDYQADKQTTFTVSAGYREAFDGNSHGYDAMVGVRYRF